MSAGPRSLPGRPSLRYLKLEAKRRLSAGEFATLHDAQTAIAREHGLPSWPALKQKCSRNRDESHALGQLMWVVSRFRDAGKGGWTAPGDAEMRQHFDDRLLAVVPAGSLVAELTRMAAELRGEPVVIGQAPLRAQAQLAGVRYIATVDADPPHRLTGLRVIPLGERITDPRVTAPPPARVQGEPGPAVEAIADGPFAELGLAALLMAGGEPGRPPWVVARGHADLDRAEVLDPRHRFPASGVTALVTATAVLRLVAAGRLPLDARANEHLRTVRLADDAVTVRQLLSHTGGVDNPAELYADANPDTPGLAALMGPVIPCGRPRGIPSPSNGGYAVLGQLIADVTGTPYPAAVTRLVLDPLGLRDCRFPEHPADHGPNAVTCYTVTVPGVFVPFPAKVSTVPAVAGLWATGADLVRLGTGWSRLLPPPLAREAVTPQASRGEPWLGGYRVGLGWLIDPDGDTAVHAGAGVEAVALLRTRVRDHRTHVVLTSRSMTVESIDDLLSRSWLNERPTKRGSHVPALPR
jgi:CubicO group peptidase (beta-lactamase class C family)